MKKCGGILVFFLFVFLSVGVFAQDASTNVADDFFEGDLDSLFEDIPEEPANDTSAQGEKNENPPPVNTDPSAIASALRKIGFSLDAGFNFAAGYLPGWKIAPWYWENDDDSELDHAMLAKMESSIALDFQVSDVFRVRQAFSVAIPNLALSIPEFFFDYNLFNLVFFRAGKYVINWGISPNFPFANLPSRIPSIPDDGNTPGTNENYSGDVYLIRADIPVGIGGFQLAAMTRSSALDNFLNNNEEIKTDLGRVGKIFFGLKYNVAIPIVDIDTGFVYNSKLDSKAFLALKTTLFDEMELYAEGLLSYNFDSFDNFAGAVSVGIMQDFFDDQLSVNAELYYNGEKNASYIPNKSFLGGTDPVAFIQGFNTALNIRYKPFWLKKTEFLLKYLHGFDENTVQLVPGFRLTPLSNVNLYVAVPMSLGDKDGYYYINNVDEKNRPFSVIVMLTFGGSYRYSNH